MWVREGGGHVSRAGSGLVGFFLGVRGMGTFLEDVLVYLEVFLLVVVVVGVGLLLVGLGLLGFEHCYAWLSISVCYLYLDYYILVLVLF
jgi:hypothetical protein